MKRLAPSESGPRFQAQIRHYHRTTVPKDGSWDRWVDGVESKVKVDKLRILKRTLIVLAVLALVGGLVVGFINIA